MTTKPVHVFATWVVTQGNLQIVLSLLTEVAQKSREEKGNLFYNIHQSNADENTLLLYEGYIDDAAIAAHRNSAHFKVVVEKIVPLLAERQVTLATPLSI